MLMLHHKNPNMKLTIVLFITLLCQSLQSQEYNFDLLTQYSSSYSGITQNRTVYASTRDTSFVMMIGDFSGDSEAQIIDYKTRRVHLFKVKKLENDSRRYEFKYRKTIKLKIPRVLRNYDFTFENIKSDSITSEVNLTIFIREGKESKELGTTVLKLMKSDVNFFKLYRLACLHPFERMLWLTLPGDFLVMSGTGMGSNGVKSESRLADIKSEKLTIKIPIK